MAAKKKTTKAKSTKKTVSSKKMAKKEEVKQEIKKIEPVYSFEELAEIFGISKIKARAYFNICQLDYSEKITIKKARELFKKF